MFFSYYLLSFYKDLIFEFRLFIYLSLEVTLSNNFNDYSLKIRSCFYNESTFYYNAFSLFTLFKELFLSSYISDFTFFIWKL